MIRINWFPYRDLVELSKRNKKTIKKRIALFSEYENRQGKLEQKIKEWAGIDIFLTYPLSIKKSKRFPCSLVYYWSHMNVQKFPMDLGR